ncbi:MAG: hypothetical protein R2911_33790 [Caldilineaceae bacterium]
MQIELIGCTSAGKSTLKSQIVAACRAQRLPIWDDKEFILHQVGLNGIKLALLRTLLVDGLAFIACVVNIQRHLSFHRLTLRMLRQLPLSTLGKFYIWRNVLRKLGKYEIIHFYDDCHDDGQLVLVDEGVLQIAHNLFVHTADTAVQIDLDSLLNFAKLAPPPDAVIYLRQPAALLVERILARGHKRIANPTPENVARFVDQAVSAFDRLVEYPTLKPKTLLIEDGTQVIAPTHSVDAMLSMIAQVLQESIGETSRTAAAEPDVTHANVGRFSKIAA